MFMSVTTAFAEHPPVCFGTSRIIACSLGGEVSAVLDRRHLPTQGTRLSRAPRGAVAAVGVPAASLRDPEHCVLDLLHDRSHPLPRHEGLFCGLFTRGREQSRLVRCLVGHMDVALRLLAGTRGPQRGPAARAETDLAARVSGCRQLASGDRRRATTRLSWQARPSPQPSSKRGCGAQRARHRRR